MERGVLNRVGAVAGVIGVVGNMAGVAVLGEISSAYRPDEVAMWTGQVLHAPGAASASGIAFTVGLIALAGWALVMGARFASPTSYAAAFVMATGAILNAAGTPAPLVVVHLLGPACGDTEACHAAAMALLGASLALDALFNLLLGVGLILMGRAMFDASWPAWLAWGTIAAGVASVPVSTQVVSPAGADLLLIAGPLWLAAITLCSVRLWRERA
ncbi:MAG: hypothetical protein IT183_11395 [Acidobacteria bacterium]|nr:hypothetical protein [Acidobacteriota bacterium]